MSGTRVKTTDRFSLMNKLRKLSEPEVQGVVTDKMRGSTVGMGQTVSQSASSFVPATDGPQYQSKLSSFIANSLEVTTQATLAADRRSVRVSMTPVFNTVTDAKPVVSYPGIPGSREPRAPARAAQPTAKRTNPTNKNGSVLIRGIRAFRGPFRSPLAARSPARAACCAVLPARPFHFIANSRGAGKKTQDAVPFDPSGGQNGMCSVDAHSAGRRRAERSMAMFHTLRKPNSVPWSAMAVLTATMFGATAGLEWAAEPAPPLSEKQLTYRDIQLTVHARKALAEDKLVGPDNLGVRVQNNVAVLWGPISSEPLKKRAVEIVKKVKGVFEVRDADVYIAAPPPEIATAALPPPSLKADAPTRSESASPDPVSGKILSLTSRAPIEAPMVALRAPLPLHGSAPIQTVSEAPRVEGLEAAVQHFRQSDERFRSIHCRLAGNVIVLQPGGGRPEDVMAFARAISHVPGLARIEIQNGDGAPPR